MEQQIRVKRVSKGDDLGFQISFDPGNDAGDSITLPYKAFQQLMWLGPQFISSCRCSEIIQRWNGR